MEQHELEQLKQQAERLEEDVTTIMLELQRRVPVIQEQLKQARQLEAEQSLAIRLLKVRASHARASPYPWLGEYYQQELTAKQHQFEVLRQQHAQAAKRIRAEQAQFVARSQILVTQLQLLNQKLLQFELMALIHPEIYSSG